MNIEQCKEIYESLKKGKDFIANIDKDFFLNFAELLFDELENKQDDINILQAQRDSMEYQLNQAKAELEKKEAIINEMSNFINLMGNELVAETGDNNLEFCKMQKCIDNGELDCEECIKEYFTKKVEGK